MNLVTKQEVVERLSALYSPDELRAMDAEIDAYIEAEKARRSAVDAAEANLVGMVATLRQWAADADTAVAAWDAWTTAQRFAACKTTVQRLGVAFGRLADMLVAIGK